MKGLDFKAAGVEPPRMSEVKQTKKEATKKDKPKGQTTEEPKKDGKPRKKEEAAAKDAGSSKGEGPKAAAQERKSKVSAKEDSKATNDKDTRKKQKATKEAPPAAPAPVERKQETHAPHQSRNTFVLQPAPRWSDVALSPLTWPSSKVPSDDEMASLQQRGAKLLDSEKLRYAEMTRSGKGMGPGMLSSSDARLGGGLKNERLFIDLRRAHDCLVEPVRRLSYDRFGEVILEWTEAISVREFFVQGIQSSMVFYVINPVMFGLMHWINGERILNYVSESGLLG